MAPTEPEDRAAVEVEETLRRALEPHPTVVDRLVRTALAATAPPAPKQRPVWALVGAAAVALAILGRVLIPTLPPTPPQVGNLEPLPGPAVLTISNEDGPITVTTPAGSKMILLPGDRS